MKNNYIFNCVNQLIEKYDTNCPFELMKLLNIRVKPSNLEKIKGYCVIIDGVQFAALNENLVEQEKRIVAAHELGHLILHTDKLMTAAHYEKGIYSATDKTEYQANLFAADLLISDEDVDNLAKDPSLDYFSMASILNTNPQLLGFKLFSMASRGYKYNVTSPRSDFLA